MDNQPDNVYVIPHVGDKIYIPTSLFVTHGVDDFIGGLCTFSKINNQENLSNGDHQYWIEVEEDRGTFYSWIPLMNEQETLKKEFGNKKGYKRPDYRQEFNSL